MEACQPLWLAVEAAIGRPTLSLLLLETFLRLEAFVGRLT